MVTAQKPVVTFLRRSLFFLLLLSTCVCLTVCQTTKGQSNTAAIALKSRLSDSLNGLFASQYTEAGTPSSEGDQDESEESEQDESVPFLPNTQKRIGNPVCRADLLTCAAIAWTDGDRDQATQEIELGWFDKTPPDTSSNYETETCFQSPFPFLDLAENRLLFAYDENWSDVASFLLTIEGVDGYGLLELDDCGQVLFPSRGDLCRGLEKQTYTLSMHGALMTFDRTVGPTLDFSISFTCR